MCTEVNAILSVFKINEAPSVSKLVQQVQQTISNKQPKLEHLEDNGMLQ